MESGAQDVLDLSAWQMQNGSKTSEDKCKKLMPSASLQTLIPTAAAAAAM
jgi:hypothetical protein